MYDSKDTYIDFSDSFDRYKFTEFVSYSPATLNSYIKTLTYQKVDEEYLEALAYYNGIVQDYSQNTLILDTKI
ncbi:hypothetical protein GW750_05430 [bacterium]|nr:hypothetical protein [bacterium]